jgi:uncharacterized protein YfaS (alpha-2-macroglobulin family)
MKSVFKSILVLASVALIALVSACNSAKNAGVDEVKVNPQFAKYVTAYSGGRVSVNSGIQIQLAKSFDGPIDYDKPISKEIFSIDPGVEGDAFWVNPTTIEFVPKEKLEPGKNYKATVDLDQLVKDLPDDYKTFEFNFNTVPTDLRLFVDGVRHYSFENPKDLYVEGRLLANDNIDTNLIQKSLTAAQNGSSKNITWSHKGLIHTFKVQHVERGETSSDVMLEYSGEAIGVGKNQNKKVKVAALGEFEVTDIQVKNGKEQVVEVHFSDPLDLGQDLNGMATIGAGNTKSSIEDNIITLYPKSRITGTSYVKLDQGIKNYAGFKLGKTERVEIEFSDIAPSIELIGDGVIVPDAKGLHFPFKAINLSAVDVYITKVYENNMIQFFQVNKLEGTSQLKRVGQEVFAKKFDLDPDKKLNLKNWNKYALDLSKIIQVEKGAIYRVSLRMKKEYALVDCGAVQKKDGLSYVTDNSTEWSEQSWSTGYYYDDYYDYGDEGYNYREKNNPCSSSYYRNKGVSRNVLVSDIGIIAKAGGDKKMHVFLTDINTTAKLVGAKVEFFNFQQQKIGQALTDSEGMVEMELDEKPFVLVASNAGQKGYLRLRNNDSKSVSKFEVEGATVQKGVKGFIYGERGVWRPGDSIYVSFILEDKEDIIPDAHPVSFRLINPRGNVVDKQVTTTNVNGHYDFRTATYQDAPTGNYQAKIMVGNRVFRKTLKVETVKPNRLKIALEFDQDMVKAGEDVKGNLDVRWLHGAVAKNLKAKVDATIKSTRTSFKGYDGFVFDDPIKRYNTNQKTVFEGKLDAKGQKSFTPNLKFNDASPGMLYANFFTKVFEQGGAFSVNRSSIKISPYEGYVGVKVPKGEMYGGTLVTDEDHMLEIATLTEDGKPRNSEVEVEFFELKWRYWWDSYSRDISSYIAKSSTVALDKQTIKTVNGKGTYKMRVNRPSWGRFLVRITDKKTGHTTGKIVYIDWPYWARANRKNNENATMLAFSADKDKYSVADEVKLTIPSSEGGKALISVETGTKIVKKFWVNTVKGETKVTFKTTKEMAPNAYVHVTVVQPHKVTANDLPIRLYGVVPIAVENPNSHLKPVISMKDELRPETTASIKVSESGNKPMTYTLAIVDDGLLDLTGYRTPNPWGHFYAKEALGVRTWDLYDNVMGAFGAEINQMLAIGGGGDGGGGKKPATANRFKPMVRFVGPFEYDGKNANTHNIEIPNYVGSVRVMVVAGGGDSLAYGSTEKTVPVRSPLMVLGTLPRVLGPDEEVDLPVNVFAMDPKIKEVTVRLETNEFLQVVGPKTKTVKFSKVDDKIVNFRVKVARKLGIGTAKIFASSGNEKARFEVELDVRSPNPPSTDVYEMVLQPGEEWNKDVNFNGVTGTNEATLELSSFPPLNMEKRLKYLIQYPHGCVEQTTSGAFPQLYLGSVMELNNDFKIKMQQNVEAAIQRLQLFQTSGGGFSYWPGQTDDNEWGSNYAGHFLLEAEAKGYTIPYSLKSRWLRYQKKKAKNWSKTTNRNGYYGRYDDLTQAYRLYTLAKAKKAELGAMNRLRERTDLSLPARWRLACAYQLAGQTSVAKQLIKGQGVIVPEYVELSYTYGSNLRDEAMILETLALMGETTKGAILAQRVAKQLASQRWMSTQTTAYSLLAIGKYLGDNAPEKIMTVDYKVGNKSTKTRKTMKPMFSVKIEEGNDKAYVKNTGKGVVFARLIVKGVPVAGNEASKSQNVHLNINYTDTKGAPIDVKNIEQGTDFVAEVTITNPGSRGYLKEMALTQIFPSGWEIHNSRMDGFSSAFGSSYFDYQDIRDDRVYTYYSLSKGKKKTYRIQLNATYLGKFYMPMVQTEAMYDNTILSRTEGQWVNVVKQEGM